MAAVMIVTESRRHGSSCWVITRPRTNFPGFRRDLFYAMADLVAAIDQWDGPIRYRVSRNERLDRSKSTKTI